MRRRVSSYPPDEGLALAVANSPRSGRFQSNSVIEKSPESTEVCSRKSVMESSLAMPVLRRRYARGWDSAGKWLG